MSELYNIPTCNPNVNCAYLRTNPLTGSQWFEFTPDENYAIWLDDETGNLDENGNPIAYSWAKQYPFTSQEQLDEYATHVWARLIDDTMEIYGGNDEPDVEIMSDEAGEATDA